CGNRILKALENSLDPDETPQNVARRDVESEICAAGIGALIKERVRDCGFFARKMTKKKKNMKGVMMTA
ncbi:hypothetical protein DPMN_139425, partial [Dreissena polymorpha]